MKFAAHRSPHKYLLPTLLTMVMAVLVALPGDSLASSGTPGAGFEAVDDCGYITGTSTDVPGYSDNGGELTFDAMTDAFQGCYDNTGYFIGSDFGGDPQESFGWGDQFGFLDLAWDTAGFHPDVAHVDLATGEWLGYAWNEKIGWIWFDWTCASCIQSDYDTYRVQTDMTDGSMTGYAWNDSIGWIPFYGLNMELPPYDLTAELSIRAMPADLDVAMVDINDAPFSDGYQYYTLSLRLLDNITGEYLKKSDFSLLSPTITSVDGGIYLDQVNNTGDAVEARRYNPDVTGCETLGALGGFGSCAVDTGGDEWQFESYVFSGSPTSDMVGLDWDGNSLDGNITFATDRDGCVDFYDGFYNTCPGTGTTSKDFAFHERSIDRNRYLIEEIRYTLAFTDASRDASISGMNKIADGVYDYTFGDPDSESNLKFRPRYFADNFFMDFGGEVLEYVPGYMSVGDPVMDMNLEGTMNATSAEYQNAVGSSSVGWTSNIRMDALSDIPPGGPDTNVYLQADSVGAPSDTADVVLYTQSLSTGTSSDSDSRAVYVTYEQDAGYLGACAGSCVGPSNTLTLPTAEHWICDSISQSRFGGDSCYFVGYMDRGTAYVDPEPLKVIGAVNANLAADILKEEDVAYLGSASYNKVRNQIFESVSRLTLGQSPSGVTYLDATFNPFDVGAVSILQNGSIYFAKDDLTITGASFFSEKTVIVMGGDLYIDGSIWDSMSGAQIGLIVLKANGKGGNVYVGPNVTDIRANIFADGGFYSYSGNPADIDVDGVPVWPSDRFGSLKNQLYIEGSLSSRNSVNSAEDEGAGSWVLGDGTTTNDYDIVVENDLNMTRQFRRCYPTDGAGNIDYGGEPLDCGEGELRSVYATMEVGTTHAPLIINYSPPSATLPVFNNSGLTVTTQ